MNLLRTLRHNTVLTFVDVYPNTSPLETLHDEAATWFMPDRKYRPEDEDEADMILIKELNETLAFLDRWIIEHMDACSKDLNQIGTLFIARIRELEDEADLDCETEFDVHLTTSGRKIGYIEVLASLSLLQVDRAYDAIMRDEISEVVSILCDIGKTISELCTEVMSTISDEIDRQRMRDLAVQRHANSPKAKEKQFVKSCFDEWKMAPSRYRSIAAFAKDMLDKCEHLKSQRKIEDWVREWQGADRRQ